MTGCWYKRVLTPSSERGYGERSGGQKADRTVSAEADTITSASTLAQVSDARLTVIAARDRFAEPDSMRPWSPQTTPINFAWTKWSGSKRQSFTSQSRR